MRCVPIENLQQPVAKYHPLLVGCRLTQISGRPPLEPPLEPTAGDQHRRVKVR